MFSKPGYRGLSFLPYPRHIKQLMKHTAQDSKKNISGKNANKRQLVPVLVDDFAKENKDEPLANYHQFY